MKNKILLIIFLAVFQLSGKCQDTLVYYSQAEYEYLQNQLDSLEYYKSQAAVNKALNPFDRDGYKVNLVYSDTGNYSYDYKQRGENVWLNINMNGNRIMLWKKGNDIEYWYGRYEDSVYVSDKIFYFDLDWISK